MLYKQYGNTSEKVSAIGMGCMRFSDQDILAKNYTKYIDLILYAHENGINYFDTAPFYCHDKCESIAGAALSQLPRDSYYITSKTNLETLHNNTTRDEFMKRLETSLKRLKVDYIDFYHLWCMLDLQAFQKNCDALYEHFEFAKSQGLIRHLVMSSHMSGYDIKIALDKNLFEGVVIGYNALNYKYRIDGIKAAAHKKMGVAIMNPLGGGLIVDNPKIFSFLTKNTDFNAAQSALRFAISQKEISVVLSGFTEKEQIDQAISATKGIVQKPAQDICASYENDKFALNTLCTGCGYCNHCPMNIEIPKLMDAYNDKLLGKSMIKRLRNHWHMSTKNAIGCIKCGKCENLCTQHLPIIERINEIACIK